MHRRLYFLTALIGITLTASIGLWAQKQPELTADEPITISREGTELVAKGHAQIIQDRFFLESNEIHYSKNGGGGTASGHVQVGVPPVRIVADTLGYRIDEGDILAEGFRMGMAPMFVQGDHVQGNATAIALNGVTAYWQEPDAISPNIYAQEATYYPKEERIIASNVLLRVGKIPFFYLPYMNVRTFERPFSFDGKVGYRRDLGAYAKTTSYFDVLPDAQAGLVLDYYTKRGFMVGPALRHQHNSPCWEACGKLESGYINDHGDRGVDILGNPIPESRRFVRLREKATAHDSLDITAKIDYWSDSYVTRDFRPEYYFDNQEPDNFVEGVYRGDGYYVGVFTRMRPNNFETLVARLPEVSFNWTPSAIGSTGLYHQFDIAASHLQKKSLRGLQPEIEANRLDFYYSLYRPFVLTPWVTFTPLVGARITNYSDIKPTLDAHDNYTRFLGQIGADLDFKAQGLWDYCNPRWGIDGLRHNLMPIIQYRYIPKADQGQARIPHLDDTVFIPYPQPIDLGERRDIDHMQDTNLIRFGLQNTLETRCSCYDTRELATLDLYQDFRFHPKPDNRTWSDFYTELNVFPTSFLGLRIYSRIDPETLTSKELNTSFKLHSGRSWSVELGTSALQHLANQFWISTFYQFNERNRIFAFMRYDARKNEFTEEYFSYWFRLGNAWEIEPYLTRRLSSIREQGWEVGLRVAIIDL